jgi:hypothetical protein
MEELTINLQESSDAKGFKSTNLIHKKEFNTATGWIKDRMEKKYGEKERLHDTITILGSRGSGKTSFLYSLLNQYQTHGDIEVIDIIDPTLIEEKGHIFLTIISLIKEKITKKIDKDACCPDGNNYERNSTWKECLRKLSHGLPSIDGVGLGLNEETWQDAEYIMDKGLKNVHSAKNLEENFNKFVGLSLKILGKKVFIIPFDDIDIDFKKGWPVLETVRKYLTSPQIITILSGDLRLFSKAIRKQQWDNFGKGLLKNEGDNLGKISEYNDLVTEMEGQYLQKILKPQRRIHLTTLSEKINLYGIKEFTINVEIQGVKKDIITLYDEILAKFGIRNKSQTETYRSFLLSLPIRTQIQFLIEYNPTKGIKDMDVTDAFLSDLYEKQVKIEYAKSITRFLNITILEFLIKEKALDEAYQLQPTTTDSSLNSSLLSLSFLFSQKTLDNPYLIFDYFIRIGYVRNLLSVLGYQDEADKKTISQLKPSIEGLCKHSPIFYDRVYRDILGSMTAYIRAFLNQEKENSKSWGGTIPIYALAETQKGKGKLSMRIDKVFEDEIYEKEFLFQKQVAYIPVSISQPNNKQDSLVTYSIYVLLGTIGEIIKQHAVGADFEKTIGELSQIRSYAMPNFKYSAITEEEGEDGNENINSAEKTESKFSLKEEMVKWIDAYPKNYAISPHLLGKISTRLFYALRTLEDGESVNNLGDAMHNRVIILLNSILVEEAREAITTPLNNNNPRGNVKIFKDNVQKCSEKHKEELKLFFWIFSCPLLLLFLNKDDSISEIVESDIDRAILENAIYSKLKKVEILGSKPQSNPKNKRSFSSNQETVNALKELNLMTFDDFMEADGDHIRTIFRSYFKLILDKTIIDLKKEINKNKLTW